MNKMFSAFIIPVAVTNLLLISSSVNAVTVKNFELKVSPISGKRDQARNAMASFDVDFQGTPEPFVFSLELIEDDIFNDNIGNIDTNFSGNTIPLDTAINAVNNVNDVSVSGSLSFKPSCCTDSTFDSETIEVFARVNSNRLLGAIDSNTENVTVVPEPLTILGSLSAIGIGTALKKKHSRKLQKANDKA